LPSQEDFITSDQACELSGYSTQHLRKLLRDEIKKAEIERVFVAKKFGRTWMIDRATFLHFVESARKDSKDDRRRGPKSDLKK